MQNDLFSKTFRRIPLFTPVNLIPIIKKQNSFERLSCVFGLAGFFSRKLCMHFLNKVFRYLNYSCLAILREIPLPLPAGKAIFPSLVPLSGNFPKCHPLGFFQSLLLLKILPAGKRGKID